MPKEAMKIEAKELREQNRVKLETVIPLSMPYVIYIDPTNLCNFKCKFCPTGDLDLLKQVGREQSSIDFEWFKKIINDIQQFDQKLKLLSLYKDGEPLVNKDFAKMVRYAKEADIAQKIWTKTNGALLNPKLNSEIIDAGLDMIHISVESTSEDGYFSIANVNIDYEEFKSNIKDFYDKRNNCKMYIKIIDVNLSDAEKEKFYNDFTEICDFISIEKLMGWSHSDLKDFTMGISSDTYDGLPLIKKEVCAYPFYVLAVNADGSVSVCGNDWSYKTAVGNIKEESLLDIWQGKKLFELRKMFLEFRRSENSACADCYYLQIVPDNLDKHTELILKVLNKQKDN